jgi:hypothetical protein
MKVRSPFSGNNVPAEIENHTPWSPDYSFHNSFHLFHIGNRES